MCARTLHMRTESYAENKVCNGLAGESKLATMPQVRAVHNPSPSPSPSPKAQP